MASGSSSSSANAAQSMTNENHIHAYEVIPLSTCPHLNTVKEFDKFEIDVNQECPKCVLEEDKKIKENWICLTCHSVNCSRYVCNHAIEHFTQNPNHSMAISTVDLSVWCYVCENYVHNEKLLHAKNELHLIKFGVGTPEFH